MRTPSCSSFHFMEEQKTPAQMPVAKNMDTTPSQGRRGLILREKFQGGGLLSWMRRASVFLNSQLPQSHGSYMVTMVVKHEFAFCPVHGMEALPCTLRTDNTRVIFALPSREVRVPYQERQAKDTPSCCLSPNKDSVLRAGISLRKKLLIFPSPALKFRRMRRYAVKQIALLSSQRN